MSRRARALFLIGFAFALWGAFFPGWGWLVWLAPAPFFLALRGVGLRRGLLWGLAGGLAFFALGLSPILSLWPFLGGLSVPAWLLLSAYGALFFAALGGLVGWRDSPPLWAGAWVLLEAARAAGPLGFSFGTLPVALVGSPFLPAAAWGGSLLLSLGVAWSGAWLARGLRRPGLLPWALLGPAALGLLALLAPAPTPQGELRVTLVQPGFSQEEKLDWGNLPQLLAVYRKLLSGLSGPLDLVVIPENALPAFLLDEPQYLAPFQETARRLSCNVLVGTGVRRGERVFNSALLIGPRGDVAGIYDMVHLVPFGEYLPGRRLWEALGLGGLLSQLLPYDLTPGEAARPLGDYGAMICFESQFPWIARSLTLAGAEVLIALTNDAWFGRTRFPWEHFAMGALRAAECGRTFLQAAQTGISGGFNARGRPLETLPPWGDGVLELTVPLYRGRSPFARWGDMPALALAGGLALAGLWGAIRHYGRS